MYNLHAFTSTYRFLHTPPRSPSPTPTSCDPTWTCCSTCCVSRTRGRTRGSSRHSRESLTTTVHETDCSRQSSAPRTTTRSAPISASRCWWRSSLSVKPRGQAEIPNNLSNILKHLNVLEPPDFPELPVNPLTARTMLDGAGDLKRKWTWAVEWLHDELERGGGHRCFYYSCFFISFYS